TATVAIVQGSQGRGARSVSGSCSSSSPGAGEAGTGRPPSMRSAGEKTPGLRSKTRSARVAASASASGSIRSEAVGAGSGVASAGERAGGQALLLRYRPMSFLVAQGGPPRALGELGQGIREGGRLPRDDGRGSGEEVSVSKRCSPSAASPARSCGTSQIDHPRSRRYRAGGALA